VKVRRLPAAVALLTCVWALPAIAADFKIPPTPDHRVTDNAGVLSAGTRASIENQLQAYETSTGHQIVVWIGQTTGDVPLETWTGETADQWKIGRRGHDDGAVLFVFMRDRKVRIEVGYGLESALTDADANRIVESYIVPRMRAGDVDGAVSSGVAAMLTTITPSYTGVASPPPESRQSVGNGFVILLSVVPYLILALIIFRLVMLIVTIIRYGYLVTREGSTRATADMRRWWYWGGGFAGGGGSGGGGFSAGGGGFGGGGASGGW
jgi:uncharacterized protein